MNRGCSLCIGFQFGRAVAKRKQITCEGGGDRQMCFSLLSPTQHVQSVYVLEMGVCVMYVHSTQYISCM